MELPVRLDREDRAAEDLASGDQGGEDEGDMAPYDSRAGAPLLRISTVSYAFA